MPDADLYFDIAGVRIAHECTLDHVRRCEYPLGRGSYGLVYALEGRAEYRFLAGDRVTLTTGDVLLLSPDAAYSIVTDIPFRHYTVNFDVHSETTSSGMSDSCFLLFGECSESLEHAFSQIVHTWDKKRATYKMQSIGLLYRLLAQLCLTYAQQNGGRTDRSLQIAKEYIEQHFDEPIGLRKLAYLCSMSITNFRREWGRRYLQTPMQYRDAMRLYYAKEYLQSGYYTVSETAKKCGFEDVSYFVRFFKKQTGRTPGDYKKQL